MEIYKLRPGVVLTEVCGEYLLVAAASAREHCPYVTLISESAAFLWERMKQGADLDALTAAAAEEYEAEDLVQIRTMILEFIRQMRESGYVLEEGEENEKE